MATRGRPKKSAAKPEAAGKDERIAVIHLKGTPAYAEFLEAVHRKTMIPKATLFRVGFAEWCKKNGHGTPPEM